MKRVLLVLTLAASLALPAVSLAATAASQNEQGTLNSLRFTVTQSKLVAGHFKLVNTVSTVTATLPADANNLQVSMTDNGDGTGHINGVATIGSKAAVLFDGDVLIPDPGLVFTGNVACAVAVTLPSGETISALSDGAALVRAVMKRGPAGEILTGLVTLKISTANPTSDAAVPNPPAMLTVTFPNTKLAPVPVP